MSALKLVDKWWSKRAPVLLGGALLVLAVMSLMLYVGQLQSNDLDKDQADQIASLSKALDDQREAAKEGGAKVVVPPSKEIKEDPSIVQGVKGDKGDSGLPGVSGPSGPPGPVGSPGVPGTPGASGSPGAPGTDGANGQDGANGEAGVTGQDGALGPVGPTGPQGEPGPAGRDGVDGKDGTNGTDGSSPSSISIPIGAITYVCTPKESGSTEYTCAPELGNSNSRAASKVSLIPVHPAILLPGPVGAHLYRRRRDAPGANVKVVKSLHR